MLTLLPLDCAPTWVQLYVPRAIFLASLSPAYEFKTSALIFDSRRRVLGHGTNQPNKSHPVQAWWAKLAGRPKNIYLHAEVCALLNAGREDKKYALIVRVNSGGIPVLARPCEICQGYLEYKGVEVAYHS